MAFNQRFFRKDRPKPVNVCTINGYRIILIKVRKDRIKPLGCITLP